MSENTTINCIGTVTARRGCWSFMKGGFILDEPLDYSLLFFQVIKDVKNIMIPNEMTTEKRNEKIAKGRALV